MRVTFQSPLEIRGNTRFLNILDPRDQIRVRYITLSNNITKCRLIFSFDYPIVVEIQKLKLTASTLGRGQNFRFFAL